MSLAETAQLTVLLKLQNQLGSGVTQAEGQLASLNATAGKTGGATVVASKGLGAVERAAGGLGGALSHAKGAIGGMLTGPLGLIGLGAGLFTVSGIIKSSIGDVQTLGLAVEKLTAITGENATTVSAQIALFTKYGLGADGAVKSFGFLEKTVGKYTQTAAKAAAFEKAYGFALIDNNGKVKSANTLLLQLADYYNGSATTAQKATLAAALFGRGYTTMIPILKLGSKGILENEAAAKSLGLTLTNTNLHDVQAFVKAQRDLGESLGGVKLQIGLVLIPLFTQLSQGIQTFLRNGGKDQIIGFFKGVVVFAKEAGAAIHDYILPVFGAIASAWGSVPAPLKSLLIAGVVGNKLLKVTFGFDPLKIVTSGITDALGGAVKQFFGRGSPANPMFVVQEGGSGGVPGAPVAGAGAGAASAAGIVTPLIGAGIALDMRQIQPILDNELSKFKALIHAVAPNSPGGLGEGGDKNLASNKSVVAGLTKLGINLTAISIKANGDLKRNFHSDTTAVASSVNALRGSQRAGFDSVVAAVNNAAGVISGAFGSYAGRAGGLGPGGLAAAPSISGGPLRHPGRGGTPDLHIAVTTTTSARNVHSINSQQARMGPTAVSAGAAVRLP